MFGNIDEFGKRRPTTYNDPDKFLGRCLQICSFEQIIFSFYFQGYDVDKIKFVQRQSYANDIRGSFVYFLGTYFPFSEVAAV